MHETKYISRWLERQKDNNVMLKYIKEHHNRQNILGCKNFFTFPPFKPNYEELDHFSDQSTLCYAGLLYLPAETC